MTTWTFDHRINLGHILTTVTILASVVVFGSVLEKRVTLLEDRIERQQLVDARQDTMLERSRYEVLEMLQRLEMKLDRNIEREITKERARKQDRMGNEL